MGIRTFVPIAVEVSKGVTAGETPWIADHPKVAVIITFIVFSSDHTSPQFPHISQWTACDKPLGVWNALWVVQRILEWVASLQIFGSVPGTVCVFSGAFASPAAC